jgi:hypothetical protein
MMPSANERIFRVRDTGEILTESEIAQGFYDSELSEEMSLQDFIDWQTCPWEELEEIR